jgi:predicted transcriptional regulator
VAYRKIEKPNKRNTHKPQRGASIMVKLNKTDEQVIAALKEGGELTLQEIADKTGEKPKKVFKSLRKLFENELIETNARKYKLASTK